MVYGDGALFDDGSRWKHKTSASHVVFASLYSCFCLYDALDMLVLTVFVSLVVLKSAKTKDSLSEHRSIGKGTKDKALDYSDSVEDLKNVVTNSMQGKMYAYKNRKRRRRRQLPYKFNV